VTAPASVVGALAECAIGVRQGDVGAALEAAARTAFVDWLGVTIGGSDQPIVTALLDGLEPGSGPSRVVGRSLRAVPSLAALVNGSAAHVLELDDIYSPGLFHPGAPVIAAALAVADQHDVTFGRLLRAVIVGYEVGGRLSADLGPSHYRHWHTTGTAGAVAAAAAAADVVELDATRLAHALALAATTTGGLQQTFRSDAAGKPLHAGAAAQAGVVAVAAARGGISGAADVLEGPAGFAAATGTTTDWAVSRSGPDTPLVIERITVKPYPCCGHTFAAIDAALALRVQGVSLEDVEQVVVETYATAVATAGIAAPRTDAERRFSLAHLVSAALALGPDGMFSAAAPADPAVDRLVPRVRLVVDEQYDERFPARRGARVQLVLTGGQRLSVDVPDRSGSPERPLSADRLADKFVSTAAPVLGERARAAYAALLALPLDAPVRALDVG
jgi:2-methylcitrate dehydratase PrpD